ncbi:hypothetical protein Nepgr_032674 [Nepenthes gracilis]|uniref:LOB domain-containing protein n=1 Tax=Nepenthes gracilis TaxID=150966 RepID=A0AAD3TKN5_NEPGR|nr:hypothetical protein Nepgr_032674 [Nepenthes gracilis]
MATGAGSPCGACKFLRRKCTADCVFAPHFCSEQGPARFAAIHKVFGASNVSKLLRHLPVHDRCEAVVTISYEAQARIRDPVYGCVAHIFALQQKVAYLQAQLMQVKAQLASNLTDPRSLDNQWMGNCCLPGSQTAENYQPNRLNPISPQSSLESIDQPNDGGTAMPDFHSTDDFLFVNQPCIRKRPSNDLGELQELALSMMRN